MFQLIYSSKETQEFSPAALKALLMSSRIRNREVNVTGILIYHGGMFLQALEGEEAAVRTIFSRISKDPRHAGIDVLREVVSIGKRRVFGEWSMGFADASGAANILKGFIGLRAGPCLSALDETQAIDILKACSQEQLHASA